MYLLICSGYATERKDAVLLGRALMVEFNIFRHVYDDHEFEDKEYFYTFNRVTRDSSNKMKLIHRDNFEQPYNMVRSRSGDYCKKIPRSRSTERLIKVVAAAVAKFKIGRSRSEERKTHSIF